MKNGTTTIAILIALVTAAVAPAMATANPAFCAPEASYVLPAQESLIITEDFTIESECDILILGDILATHGSGASITLVAAREIQILGALIAGSGAHGADAQVLNGEARAGDGLPGGSILLIAGKGRADCTVETPCSDTLLTIGRDAYLAAGHGGDGGHAVSYGINETPGECNCATAGNGAPGGSLFLKSNSQVSFLGANLFPGNGGDGGKAVAGGSLAEAAGGHGAAHGIILADGLSEQEIFAFSVRGVPGNGGSGHGGLPPTQQGVMIGGGTTPCVEPQIHGCSGIPASANCDGNFQSYSSAYGGHGGTGILTGGQGGDANAYGCDNPNTGTPGTPGTPGGFEDSNGNPCIPDPEVPGCFAIYATRGGDGGQGPQGGTASATGGRGGYGLTAGGKGGAAAAQGGTGGTGGPGGKGGDGVHICLDGAPGGNGAKGGRGGGSHAWGGAGGGTSSLGVPGVGGSGTPTKSDGGPGGAPGAGGAPGIPLKVGYRGLTVSACSPSKGPDGSAGALGDKGSISGGQGQPGGKDGRGLADITAAMLGAVPVPG
ncbi:MAG TPA: hypothetical protein VNZ52_06870, partial [Candidatus Thermoplasmatota archaeon]|nr:hypothetical protein [Candidatus Thermoplasmatota archaeon]